MATPDILDHGRRIAALERKLSELYERLGVGLAEARHAVDQLKATHGG
jgi:hypothetical protein